MRGEDIEEQSARSSVSFMTRGSLMFSAVRYEVFCHEKALRAGSSFLEKHSIPMLQSRSNCLEKHHKCDTIGWRWSDMAGSAHPLQRQYSRLSRLPKASAVSVARASHHKAASDQCPTPSAPRWFRAAALAGLE